MYIYTHVLCSQVSQVSHTHLSHSVFIIVAIAKTAASNRLRQHFSCPLCNVHLGVATAGTSTIIRMTTLPRLFPFLPHSHLFYQHFTLLHVYANCYLPPPHAHTRPHTSQSVYMQLPIVCTVQGLFCSLCAILILLVKTKIHICISYIVVIVLNCFFVVSTHAHTSRY